MEFKNTENLKYYEGEESKLEFWEKLGWIEIPKPLTYKNKKLCLMCNDYKIKENSTFKFCYNCITKCKKCKGCNTKRLIYDNKYTNKGYCTKYCYEKHSKGFDLDMISCMFI